MGLMAWVVVCLGVALMGYGLGGDLDREEARRVLLVRGAVFASLGTALGVGALLLGGASSFRPGGVPYAAVASAAPVLAALVVVRFGDTREVPKAVRVLHRTLAPSEPPPRPLTRLEQQVEEQRYQRMHSRDRA